MGAYTFSGLVSGAYIARSRVIGGIEDRTAVLTIVNSNLIAGDTLQVRSRGDLYPVPNPVVDTETFILFELSGLDTQYVDIWIRDMASSSVRRLLSARRPAGINQLRGDGLDQTGAPATAPLYWVTLEAVDGVRAQLLFK